MKRIVVFTGSGISAESGIKTFRDSDGLWEEYDVMEVATPQAWARDPVKVQHFYNLRRKQVLEASPNAAHSSLVALEDKYIVNIITQNIDDLHERAGSTNVHHLHGEIRKVRSTADDRLIYPVEGWEVKIGDTCEKGSQLRPHVVWFGEMVPAMDEAALITSEADIFIVVGTSLSVYPAAGLLEYCAPGCEKYLIDPHPVGGNLHGFRVIQDRATTGVSLLVEKLLKA